MKKGENIRISRTGKLLVEREGVFKLQGCKYDFLKLCGDDCPAFRGPWHRYQHMVSLTLCDNIEYNVKESQFADFRENRSNDEQTGNGEKR